MAVSKAFSGVTSGDKKNTEIQICLRFFLSQKKTWGGIVVFPPQKKVEGGKKWDEFHYD